MRPTSVTRPRTRRTSPSLLRTGNLRADYVLLSKSLQIQDTGVFWPADDDPLNRLTGTGVFGDPVPSSDHRLVWVDVSHGGFPKG